jgi:hypothetical protein
MTVFNQIKNIGKETWAIWNDQNLGYFTCFTFIFFKMLSIVGYERGRQNYAIVRHVFRKSRGMNLQLTHNLDELQNCEMLITVPFYSSDVDPDYEYMHNLLDSLLSSVSNVNYHVVVVNDGSKGDIDIPVIYLLSNRVTIAKFNRNYGPASARNVGLEIAMENNIPYVCFLDSDCVVAKNWIQIMHNVLKKTDNDEDNIMIVSGRTESKQSQYSDDALNIGEYQDIMSENYANIFIEHDNKKLAEKIHINTNGSSSTSPPTNPSINSLTSPLFKYDLNSSPNTGPNLNPINKFEIDSDNQLNDGDDNKDKNGSPGWYRAATWLNELFTNSRFINSIHNTDLYKNLEIRRDNSISWIFTMYMDYVGKYHDYVGTIRVKLAPNSDVIYAPTCNIGVNVKRLLTPQFDEEYPNAAFEDIDFCFHNGKIMYEENAIVYHNFGYDVYSRYYRYGQSSQIFFNKNPKSGKVMYQL